MKIEQSEVPPSVYNDIKNIKQYYLQCHRNIPLMIKKHTKFFQTIVKPNRELASPENWHFKKDTVIVEQNSCEKLTEYDPQLQPVKEIPVEKISSTSDKQQRKQAQKEKQYHCTTCKISFKTPEGLKCHVIGIHDGDDVIEQNPKEQDQEGRKIIKNTDVIMKPSFQPMEVIDTSKEIEKDLPDVERIHDFLTQTSTIHANTSTVYRKSRKQVCSYLL